jgi:phosphatidylserine/phosphatidylglycerophosphate/cardiolipin synthase-like enzyme
LVADLLNDAGPAITALGRIAPSLQHVLVVAASPGSRRPFFGSASEPDEALLHALDSLRRRAQVVAPSSHVDLVSELEVAPLVQLAQDASIDLFVTGSRSLHDASVLAEAQQRLGLAILWPSTAAHAGRAIEQVFCVPLGHAGRSSLAAFLRDHADPSLHVTLLSPTPTTPDELESIVEISGIHATMEAPRAGTASLRRLLTDQAGDPEFDLLVVTRIPGALMLAITWPTPVLLLPPPPVFTASRQRALDVADIVDDAGSLRARISYEAVFGSLAPVDAAEVAFISDGKIVATVKTSSCGEAKLLCAREVSSLGVLRLGDTAPADALAAIERRIHVLRPGKLPLLVFDCELGDEVLRQLQQPAYADTMEPLAVRLRPTRNIRAIRERLRALHLPTHVLDARAVLDEGPAFDVSEEHDPVRLMRVAARLARAGFAIAGVLPAGCDEPQTLLPPHAQALGDNRIELELDNTQARHWLLETIASSQHTLHLQVYMAADDDVGRSVVTALVEAGARGVAVRVLVDSLHGWHGSFGVENPVLARLSQHVGVELHMCRPVNELPSIADLKQRDHRKLVIADGQLALIGGRNLAHEYYTGFDEVPITTKSLWRDVPWLDAGARIAGPIVTALEASFHEAWTAAGGLSFELASALSAGTSPARVIVHRGLRDANTLEVYRELIESARSHLELVSGFPLMLELQHVLLAARARGVRVRVLTGHAAPTHAGQAFVGPWSTARAAATELVHSRLDPLVEAGCEVYSFAKQGVAGWEPELGVVHPHVHAKLISVDGSRCALGSANFDITASYWESELILLIEDPVLVRGLHAQLDSLMADSTRWNRDDPTWKKLAARRTWMRHWPGVLSV